MSAPVHVAICGSRAPDTDASVIDAAVRCLARLVMSRNYKVSHGPVGVGIEVMTYIADQYRPPTSPWPSVCSGIATSSRTRSSSSSSAAGLKTQAEVDLALSMGKPVIALPASGGTARRFYHQAARDHRLRAPLDDEQFAASTPAPTRARTLSVSSSN